VPQRHPPRDAFLGVYYIETSNEVPRIAEFIALEESAGSWSGEGSSTELYARSVAVVHDVHIMAPGKGYAAIAFPTANLPGKGSLFPALWLYLTAGPLFERPFADIVRLADVVLPEEVLAGFRGPRFGIEGTRRALRKNADSMLLGTIVKPGAGLTPPQVANRCDATARGGIDLIKDDEKMNNPSYCPLHDRVDAVVSMLRRVEDETGHRVIYCPHVTGRPDEMLSAARQAVRAGANGLMINVFATGLAALQVLSDDEDTGVPIYVHSGGRSALTRGPGSGIDFAVFAKFVRLLGGDYLDIYAQGGYLFSGSLVEARRHAAVLRDPWGSIAAVLPACSGGLNVLNIGANYDAFGRDILPMAGSAILGHPLGAAAGVMALRQASECHFRGIPLEDCSRQYPELAAALEK
jgi:ribulose 1,5-bisphosphate carboxylase large subunit-like protein